MKKIARRVAGIKEMRTFANDELKRSFILAVLLDKSVLDIIGMYYKVYSYTSYSLMYVYIL